MPLREDASIETRVAERREQTHTRRDVEVVESKRNAAKLRGGDEGGDWDGGGRASAIRASAFSAISAAAVHGGEQPRPPLRFRLQLLQS